MTRKSKRQQHKKLKKTNPLAITYGRINRDQKGCPILSDLGAPELERHHALKVDYVDSEGAPTDPEKGHKRARVLTQTTLDYCKAYALINQEQFDAGEQLYWDCYYAGMVPRAIISLMDGIPRSRTNRFFDFAAGRVDARRRYHRVQDSLRRRFVDKPRGITYWHIAYQVCIEGIPIDALEKWAEWPRRSGKKLVGLVLDEVHDLYEAMHKQRKRK